MSKNEYKISSTKTRCERKYIISLKDHHLLSSILSNIMDKDLFSNDDGNYYVRSVYFDSIDDKDFNEKRASVHTRQKVRLRVYGHDSTLVKLENKRKYGRYTQKSVALVERQDALNIIDMDYDCLLQYNTKAHEQIYLELKTAHRVPKVTIDYEREAFIDKLFDIRVNFDKNLRFSYDYNIFSKDAVTVPFQNDKYYVLEVKYGEILPTHIQSVLSGFDLTETTYSKYLYARSKL